MHFSINFHPATLKSINKKINQIHEIKIEPNLTSLSCLEKKTIFIEFSLKEEFVNIKIFICDCWIVVER